MRQRLGPMEKLMRQPKRMEAEAKKEEMTLRLKEQMEMLLLMVAMELRMQKKSLRKMEKKEALEL